MKNTFFRNSIESKNVSPLVWGTDYYDVLLVLNISKDFHVRISFCKHVNILLYNNKLFTLITYLPYHSYNSIRFKVFNGFWMN